MFPVALKPVLYSLRSGNLIDPKTGKPPRLNGHAVHYGNSCPVSVCHTMERTVYKTKRGDHFWLHTIIPGIGNYVAALDYKEAQAIIDMNDAENQYD